MRKEADREGISVNALTNKILKNYCRYWRFSERFGAVIIEIKESNAIVNLLQWVISLLMGIFFPITILPAYLQTVAKLFPPSWMNTDVRAALLDINYMLEYWYLDLAVLFAFCLILPMMGLWVFSRAEKHVKRNQGLGQF